MERYLIALMAVFSFLSLVVILPINYLQGSQSEGGGGGGCGRVLVVEWKLLRAGDGSGLGRRVECRGGGEKLFLSQYNSGCWNRQNHHCQRGFKVHIYQLHDAC